MMRQSLFYVGILSMGMLSACNMKQKDWNYPITEKRDSSSVYFGTRVEDPYRWLEDDYAPDVVNWVKEQNAFASAYLEGLPERGYFKNRLKELWNYERFSTPFRHAGETYYFHNDGVQNQSVLFRENPDGPDELILDPNQFSEDGTSSLSGMAFSKDGKLLAYGVSDAGSDWKTIKIRNMETGESLTETIPWVKFSGISWKGNGFYYSRYGEPQSGDEFSQKNEFHKVYYHSIGTSYTEDELIFEDRLFGQRNFYAGTSEDETLVYISGTESTSGNALWVGKENNTFTPIVSSFDKDFSVIDNQGNELIVLTNYKAPNKRLISISLAKPEESNWKEIIPEQEVVLESVTRAGNHYLAKYLKDVCSVVEVFNLSGEKEYELDLPGLGTVGGLSGERDSDVVYYSFTNYIYPNTIFALDLKTGKSTVHKRPEIDFDSEPYVSERVFYTSKDGTSIPLFLTYKKGLKKDGNNPVFLYGYGGFDISITPSFSVTRAVLLERDVIYAVANIRGGGEYGEKWHEAGTKMQKQNVFDDFIAAAEYLIAENYTSKGKIAAHGRSNGGLLAGAMLTQRPDLFAVTFPGVGVLDMLRYHEFTIGWAWAGDYGRSDDSPEMFEYLKGYSPVHNVQKRDYPATMVITGDHDDRVVPAHSFKFAAELQAKNTSEFPMLLRVDINAGHGAGKPVDMQIAEWADVYAFMFEHIQ